MSVSLFLLPQQEHGSDQLRDLPLHQFPLVGTY